MSQTALEFLESLEALIRERAAADPASSYTAGLLQGDPQRRAQKVGEEAVEVVLASSADQRDALLEESADLLYHLLVLLAGHGVSLADVTAVLESRHRGD